MFLRKEKAGACSSGHEWPTDGAVVEVPDDLGLELLALSREFTDVTADHAATAAEPDHDDPADADPATPKRRGRPPRTPVQE